MRGFDDSGVRWHWHLCAVLCLVGMLAGCPTTPTDSGAPITPEHNLAAACASFTTAMTLATEARREGKVGNTDWLQMQATAKRIHPYCADPTVRATDAILTLLQTEAATLHQKAMEAQARGSGNP